MVPSELSSLRSGSNVVVSARDDARQSGIPPRRIGSNGKPCCGQGPIGRIGSHSSVAKSFSSVLGM